MTRGHGAQGVMNVAMLLADELGQRLSAAFVRRFGGANRVTAAVNEAARLVIERLATSNTL